MLLPERTPDRLAVLLDGAPSGVQAVCLTPSELGDAIRRGNRLVEEALADGVWVLGERFLSEAAGQAPRPAGVR